MAGAFSHLEAALIDAALAAGVAILDIYEQEIDVRHKGDDSPVTAADEAAEAIILQKLSQSAPEIAVVAEEQVAAGNIPEIGDCFFLVDPLDGTREFIARNGEFTVNIALIKDGVPVMGVIYTPAKGWLFFGEVGVGAYRAEVMDPRVSCEVCNRQDMQVYQTFTGLVLVGSRSHKSESDAAFVRPYQIENRVAIGSSLKFCLLAAGEADLYPRFGRTMEWDIAAGDAILTAAGGQIVDLDGNRFRYGKVVNDDAPFANGYFIAGAGVDLQPGLDALKG
ncbi:3'(2'),5'-bisphosphate nucleotidase [Cohaesibacter gelatinilyticus]|uniref:3'(2'),5'-bisphosphate nucleotidase CysQ n=2 Tax=Cohaesibacter gelatinilyticus TaxID=372072 RepID=A0A285PHV0_9HYPH|nr:3'(2'),5'-bisphosphate nucleotidase [Cohaesibacter gelatinilyticus]